MLPGRVWDTMVITTEVGRVMAPKDVLILIPKTEYFPWHKWLCWCYWGSWNEKGGSGIIQRAKDKKGGKKSKKMKETGWWKQRLEYCEATSQGIQAILEAEKHRGGIFPLTWTARGYAFVLL